MKHYLDDARGDYVTAMFLFEGFRDYVNDAQNDSGYGYLSMSSTTNRKAYKRAQSIDSYLGGVIEQAHALSEVVPVVRKEIDAIVEAYTEGDIDYFGVLEYEVTNPLGHWLADYVGKKGRMPSEKRLRRAVAEQMECFMGVAGE